MFDERKKRKALQSKIDELRDAQVSLRAEAKAGEPNFDHQREVQEELKAHTRRLERFESRLIEEKARRRGIEIPKKAGWWLDDVVSPLQHSAL